MFSELVGALRAGLSLWDHKEKTKYLDKLIKLEREWYAEINKPRADQSDAELDRIERELRVTSRAWIAVAGVSNASNQP